MDPLVLAAIGFAIMLGLIAMHVPIGIAMGFVGMGGFAMVVGWGPGLSLLASEPAATLTNLNLAVIPLFDLRVYQAPAGSDVQALTIGRT